MKSEIRDSTIRSLSERVRKRNYTKYLTGMRLVKLRGFTDVEVRFDFPVTALIGPNGAGKTTMLGAIMGLLPRSQGGIRFDGSNLDDLEVEEVVGLGMNLVPESRALFGELSVEDNLLLGAFARHRSGHRDHDQTMAQVYEIFPRLRERRGQHAGTLSGGERQRARLAQLATQNPAILLCDEPLNHLDLRHQVATMQFLASAATNGKVVVASLHDPRWAQACCDHAILMYHFAHIDQGLTAEVITHNALLSLYGAAVAAHPLVAAGPWRPAESNPTRGASRPTPR